MPPSSEVEQDSYKVEVEISKFSGATITPAWVELVDTAVLKIAASAWGFESPCRHQSVDPHPHAQAVLWMVTLPDVDQGPQGT